MQDNARPQKADAFDDPRGDAGVVGRVDEDEVGDDAEDARPQGDQRERAQPGGVAAPLALFASRLRRAH